MQKVRVGQEFYKYLERCNRLEYHKNKPGNRGTKNDFCKVLKKGMQQSTLDRCLDLCRKHCPGTLRPDIKTRKAKSAKSGRVPTVMLGPDPRTTGFTNDDGWVVLGSSMSDTLLHFVELARGKRWVKKCLPEDESDDHTRELQNKHGQRLYIGLTDLVDRIQELHEYRFHLEPPQKHLIEEFWYKRVQRWCDVQKIVYRKPNATTVTGAKAGKVAGEVDRLLTRIQKMVTKGKLPRAQITNFDETSARVLALQVEKTLDWKGNPDVLKEEHGDSKLYLSIGVMWWACGRMDFVVVWRTNRKTLDGAPRWREIDGVMWFEAYSKWTRIEHYHHLLRYFYNVESGVKLHVDDEAGGHKGPAPGFFLCSVGGMRLQVPAAATWAVQAADQAGTNLRLKRLLRNAMRRFKLRLLLKQEKLRTGKLPTTLTVELKRVVSKILCTVREEMNSEEGKATTRKAFDRTLLSRCQGNNQRPHKRLAEFLECAGPAEAPKKPKAECEKCGHSWLSKCKEAKDHKEGRAFCYMNRLELLPPLAREMLDLKARAKALNSRWSPGLVAKAGNGNEYFLGREKNAVFRMSGDEWERMHGGWWNTTTIQYRSARQEELAFAVRKGYY